MSDRPKKPAARRGRTAGLHDDERPRGFQPQRMRRLWQDIDRARDGLGLGPGEEPPIPSLWSIAGVVGRLTELASGLLWWKEEEAPPAPSPRLADQPQAEPRDEPTRGETGVCTLAEHGVDLLRQMPILGRLVALVSPKSHDGAQRDTSRR